MPDLPESATVQHPQKIGGGGVYSGCVRRIIPPSCVRRLPAGDSALMILVLTFLFWAICISLWSLFFWWLFAGYVSVTMRGSGFGLLGFHGARIVSSISLSE